MLNRRDKILIEKGERAKRGDNRFTMNRQALSAPLQNDNEIEIPIIEHKKTTYEIGKEIGISKRTAHKERQIAKSLTAKAKEVVIKNDISKKDALKLCRLDKE